MFSLCSGRLLSVLFPLKYIPPCELPPPSVSGNVVPGCHGWCIFKPLPLRQKWLKLPVTKIFQLQDGHLSAPNPIRPIPEQGNPATVPKKSHFQSCAHITASNQAPTA